MPPYASDAQRKYFNVNKAKLENQGIDVEEWNRSSKGAKLPEHVKKKKAKGIATGMRRSAIK